MVELSDGEEEPGTSSPRERERDVCTTLRGVEVPPGWLVVGGSLLVWSYMAPPASARIAAFDFDDCLAKTMLGGFDPDAWENRFPHVPAVLARLHAGGHRIVVITNESCDRFKKTEVHTAPAYLAPPPASGAGAHDGASSPSDPPGDRQGGAQEDGPADGLRQGEQLPDTPTPGLQRPPPPRKAPAC